VRPVMRRWWRRLRLGEQPIEVICASRPTEPIDGLRRV
jgi:hypothetical protein